MWTEYFLQIKSAGEWSWLFTSIYVSPKARETITKMYENYVLVFKVGGLCHSFRVIFPSTVLFYAARSLSKIRGNFSFVEFATIAHLLMC
jgi:hypothetical protein